MTKSVTFSFCISSRGRTTQIQRLLQSIINIGPIMRDNYEVVCVDQNPFSTLKPVVTHYARFVPSLVYVARPQDRGLSCGRNVGLQYTRGTWVVFIDDDAEITDTYARSLMVFQGYSGRPLLLLGRTVDEGGHSTAKNWPTHPGLVTPRSVWQYSGFPMVHRAALTMIGDFDERLGIGTYFGGDEDSDYLLRAVEHGVSVLYTPSVEFLHRPEIPTGDKVIGMARGRGALLRKYRGTAFETALRQALFSYRTNLRIKRAIQHLAGVREKATQKTLILRGITEGYMEWGKRYG